MSQQNASHYWESLRKELIYIIESQLTPIAQKYAYSEAPLEDKIKWKPLVLLLGNYSSGKSTFINECLGARIQETGQAPTDDSFTVITYDGEADSLDEVPAGTLVDSREGAAFIGDPQYPFSELRRHGPRFASHFKLRKVKNDFLKNIVLVDTPGMIEGISEEDRGYDYQQAVGDLAQIADLVIVLFDPHKVGTIRETHASLKKALPQATFEDRVVFVLNRIDECSNIEDLFQVYGTLCWNLSQMVARKDLPRILLTYSDASAKKHSTTTEGNSSFLHLLSDQREELRQLILQAPKHRLGHLAAYLELHSQRLIGLLEGLLSFYEKRQKALLQINGVGMLLCFAIAGIITLSLYFGSSQPDPSFQIEIFAGLGVGLILIWLALSQRFVAPLLRKKLVKNFSSLPEAHLKIPGISVKGLRKDLLQIQNVYTKGAKEFRLAIHGISKS